MSFDETIMGPENPRWQEFCHKLADCIECSHYSHTTEGSEHVLQEMELDVEQSLDNLSQLGAGCDCEILNIESGYQQQNDEEEQSAEEEESEI